MLSACMKSAIALLLGIVGLFAAPAEAEKLPRLLFLGISEDGHAHQQAEHAVHVRLKGLGVSLLRLNVTAPSSCEHAECLTAALAGEQGERSELALSGRILKNERVCLATLWLVVNKDHEKPFEQDITCRPDGKESELAGNLADGAAAMVDDYLRHREPDLAIEKSLLTLTLAIQPKTVIEKPQRWSQKKKIAIAGLGVLLVLAVSATVSLSLLDGKIYQGEYEKGSPYSLVPHISVTGIIVGATAASIALLSFK